MHGLSGRHVVITGGTGALGRAVVAAFHEVGAVCHLPVRRAPPPPDGAADGVSYVAGVDLADEAAVTAFYAQLPAELWASVHVAGGFAGAGIVETSLADLRAQLDINLVTAFLCCREAVRRFRARGGGGRLVNVASRAALEPGGGKAAYSMAKSAVVSLTETLAVELKGEGILVNAVAPGTLDTPQNRAAMPEADPARMTSLAAVAAAIRWLASPENAVASGAVVPVYGTS